MLNKSSGFSPPVTTLLVIHLASSDTICPQWWWNMQYPLSLSTVHAYPWKSTLVSVPILGSKPAHLDIGALDIIMPTHEGECFQTVDNHCLIGASLFCSVQGFPPCSDIVTPKLGLVVQPMWVGCRSCFSQCCWSNTRFSCFNCFFYGLIRSKQEIGRFWRPVSLDTQNCVSTTRSSI